MTQQEIADIEKIIELGYNPTNKQDLDAFAAYQLRSYSTDELQTLLVLASISENFYVVSFACSQLKRIFSDMFSSFTKSMNLNLRSYLLHILSSRVEWFCQDEQTIISLNSFSQLLARVYRICWFDIPDFVGDGEIQNRNFEANFFADVMDEICVNIFPQRSISSTNDIRNTTTTSTSTSSSDGGGGDIDNDEEMSDKQSNDPMIHLVTLKMLKVNKIPSMLVGASILAALVEDMNVPISGTSQFFLRKLAVSFRDTSLRSIFKTSSDVLQVLLNSQVPVDQFSRSQFDHLLKKLVGLLNSIFSFDFIGTQPDESSDDVSIINVPSGLHPIIGDEKTTLSFFLLYCNYPHVSVGALELLSNLVSVHTAAFGSSEDQIKFLNYIFEGIIQILNSKIGLEKIENCHHLCRMLVRLKGNFQLNHFFKVPAWNNFIALVFDFHMYLLKSNACTSYLNYYIISWWSRISNAASFFNNVDNTLLSTTIPQVMEVFVESQLQHEARYSDDDDQFLKSKQLPLILNLLPVILEHCGQVQALNSYINYLDTAMAQFEQGISQNQDINPPVRQLAFLIHLVTALVVGRNQLPVIITELTPEEEKKYISDIGDLHAELIKRIFQTIQINDSIVTQRGLFNSSEVLEYAIITFLKRFCVSYFSSEELENLKIQQMLKDTFQLESKVQVLDLILSKIAMNIRNWSGNSTIAQNSIGMFESLMTTKLHVSAILKSPLVSNLLQNHHILILNVSDTKLRTEFYRILGKIAFRNLENGLVTFLFPFEENLKQLSLAIGSLEDEQSANVVYESAIILLSDLKGIVNSCVLQQTYNLFFTWFYPGNYLNIWGTAFVDKIALFKDLKPLWKFLGFIKSLVSNVHRRIHFSSTSTDGWQLFYDVSNILIKTATFVEKINESNSLPQSLLVSKDYSVEDSKSKTTWILLLTFKKFFEGAPDYCQIGFFSLLPDRNIVPELICAILRVIFSVSQIFNSYSKLEIPLYATVEVLCSKNIVRLLNGYKSVEEIQEIVYQLLVILQQGLYHQNIKNIFHCAQALEKIVSFQYSCIQYNSLHSKPKHNSPPLEIFNEKINTILTEIIFSLFIILLVDRDTTHWAVCKTLYSLIIILPAGFEQVKNIIISSQNNITTNGLQLAFNQLMEGITNEKSLDGCEKFSSKAISFKKYCKANIDLHRLHKKSKNVFGRQIKK